MNYSLQLIARLLAGAVLGTLLIPLVSWIALKTIPAVDVHHFGWVLAVAICMPAIGALLGALIPARVVRHWLPMDRFALLVIVVTTSQFAIVEYWDATAAPIWLFLSPWLFGVASLIVLHWAETYAAQRMGRRGTL